MTKVPVPRPTLHVAPSPVPGKDWGIAVTKLVLRAEVQSNNRLAAIELTFSNNNGVDQTFLPTGKIIGYIGSSGKLYTDYSPNSLEESYRSKEDS